MTCLQRLQQETSDALTCAQVADILGLGVETVYALVKQGKLETLAVRGFGESPPRAARASVMKPRHFMSRLAVLAYLVRATTGTREALFAEIEVLFPKWLPFAQRIAKTHDARPTHKHGELPLNVIPMRGAARVKPDPFAGAPEMFPLETLTRKTPA